MTPEMIPVLSLLAAVIGGVFGAYVGVKVNIVKLETKMEMVEERLEGVHKRSHRHNNDLLIHDMEIQSVFEKLEMDRVRRQQVLE